MSGISTSIGLMSGIDTGSLVDQLIAIDSRPVTTLRGRVQAIDVQRTAFMELAAKLLAIKSALSGMDRLSFFRRFNSNSSNEDILTARAGESAVPGSYTFQVHSLVTNHSVISRGFTNPDSTPVGTGFLSIEVGQGMINEATPLDQLNGGHGVSRGIITITDRNGATADIDLTRAVTIDDILRAINSDHTIEVHASVSGMSGTESGVDRIIIEDTSGGAGNLIISDVGGGLVASDLGIVADTEDARVEGHDLIRLTEDTPLRFLNDGNGVGHLRTGYDLHFASGLGNFDVTLASELALRISDDPTDLRMLNGGNGVRLGTIRITDRGGRSADIDLSTARTVEDVIALINAAEGVQISAGVVNSRFLITDESETPEQLAVNFKIEDVTGHAAADLGIDMDVEESAISGRDVYRMETVGDVINAINFAADNNSLVVASISEDGNGLGLETMMPDTVTVSAGAGSTAAEDLGLLDAVVGPDDPFETRHLIAGLNTVLLQSLNGGRGVELGVVRFTDRDNQTTEIDFAGAQGLQDVIDLINADSATSFTASVNPAGNGLVLRDGSGGGGVLTIEDVSGSLAADLGIAVSNAPADPFEGNTVDGGNLQLAYISRNTLLSDLNAGQGVEPGQLRITDSTGAICTVDLRVGYAETIGDVLDSINSTPGLPDTLEARINDTGDGIIIIDTSGGEGALSIEDIDGQAAAGLRIAGTAGNGENFIDGSYEVRIEVNAGDSLNDIIAKLNEAGGDFSASVLNDGGTVNPYSLTISSERSGRAGRLVIDTGGIDLGFDTLTEARDAVIVVGGASSSNPVLITSSTNTIDGVIEGVTLDLQSAGNEEVTITIDQDVEGIVSSVKNFVDRYNDVLGTIDDLTNFNGDTLERGPLLGDRTVLQVRNRLHRIIIQPFEGVPESVSRLFSIGIRPGTGGKLEFDEEQFREAYAESPDAVEELFTKAETGFAAVLQDTLDEMTRDTDGLLATKDDLLKDQQELLNDRIDSMNILLEKKRARLEAQFTAMEMSLAGLQAQQAALGRLSDLANGLSL